MTTGKPGYSTAVKFHGHSCPGLAIGYRIALAARRELHGALSKDEEIVCFAENDSCSVDAVQALVGCTAGKGNLVIENTGKQAFSFYSRSTGKSFRIYYRRTALDSELGAKIGKLTGTKSQTPDRKRKITVLKRKRITGILNAPENEILVTGPVQRPVPAEARIVNSAPCGRCGEWTMETMLRRRGALNLCPFCRRGAKKPD
ncbi:MAG: FmdE family protein [Elusimicrobiaceae bacterium]|nr:FmdE family protein [Elusimicrobiaceae bacterium]